MKDLNNIKPDNKKILEVAKAAAEKAYLKEIEDYYTSWDSPFRKKIKTELDKIEFHWSLDLPNFLNKINEALKSEIDKIANNAIANTYIPLLSEATVGLDKNMNFSELLKLIIKELEPDTDEFDSYYVSVNKNDRHGWLNCDLTTDQNTYSFTLHTVLNNKNKYQLLSFPYSSNTDFTNKKMALIKDDVKIEMPYYSNISSDKVLMIFFKMMLSNTHITMDCDGFNEEMLPRETCHC